MTETVSLPVPLPQKHQERLGYIDKFSQTISQRLLENYWSKQTLKEIDDYSYQAWKYFDEKEAFDDIEVYLPSRFKRCILQKVGETLRQQADRMKAFQKIKEFLPSHKIKRIHTRKIKKELYENNSYQKAGYTENLVEQLNNYYDVHGRFPSDYLDLQGCPKYSNGNLSYSADDGASSGQMIKYSNGILGLIVKIKLPNSKQSETWGDWGWHYIQLERYEYLRKIFDAGELGQPDLQKEIDKHGKEGYYLTFPVELNETEQENSDNILGVDFGLKKQASCTVLNKDFEQVSTPYFIQTDELSKIARLKRQREGINSKLSSLRRRGLAYTEKFKHLKSEYEWVQSKITNKREQLQHEVANQITFLALYYKVETLVVEDLSALTPTRNDGLNSWFLSSWARNGLLEKIKYRCNLLDIEIEQVFAGDTSRTCPRCGGCGRTGIAPDRDEEKWSGGHFKCDNEEGCGFEGDRDYVGSVNVARQYHSKNGLASADTSAYTEEETALASRSADASATLPGKKTYSLSKSTDCGGSVTVTPAVEPSSTQINNTDECGQSARQTKVVRFV